MDQSEELGGGASVASFCLQVGMQTVLFDGNMVEAVLIVSGYPELYNISSSDYHNLFLKKRAWREIYVTEYNCRYCITSQKRVSRPSCSTLCFFLKPFLCVFRHKDAFWVNGHENLRSSSEHKLSYFWSNLRALWPSIDSNVTAMFPVPEM